VNNLTTKTKIIAASAFWLLFLSVDIVKKSMLAVEDQYYFVFYYIAGFLLWFLFTLPFYNYFIFTRRWNPFLRFFTLLFSAPIVGILKVILSWLSFYTSIAVYRGISVDFISFLSRQTTFHYVEATIVAWVVLLLFFLSELYFKYKSKQLEAAELKTQLAQSQLQTLRMQLQPHFLFNAHNTISMLIRTKHYDQAIKMTSQLSDLLRITLNDKTAQFVTLKEELDFISKYTDLELIRFEDRLSITIDAEEETLKIPVPNLILQPIVENAFKHGLSKHIGDVQLTIKSWSSEENLCIEVGNTGPSLPEEFDLNSDSCIGINNVRNRLKQSYNGSYGFSYFNDYPMVKCLIKIPITYESD